MFGVHGQGEQALRCELLDPAGRVCRVKLADGTEATALLNIEPFRYEGEGIEFEGTAGLVVRKAGKTAAHAIRARKLTAE